MKARKVAIIGAGPAGLTAAYVLAKRGVDVDLYEAGGSVGGMAKSISLWGQRVDLGPHRFFSSDPRVNSLWLEVLGGDYGMVNRLTRIYYADTFFNYPLRPFNALFGLGLVESLRCVMSYGWARLFPPQNTANFENWVTSRFGSRLFGIFFKSYTEKLWGIPCNELDSDFAAQRIRKFSLLEAMKSALWPNSGSRHKTLADEFAYPVQGAGMLYERMAERFVHLGGRLHLAVPVTAVIPAQDGENESHLLLPDGHRHAYDHVISTMPITTLVERMGAPPDIVRHAKALRFRNTILVYLRIDDSNPFPDQWIYVHSSSLRTGRITNFRNWLPSINAGQAETILCLEYWCYDEDALWTDTDDACTKLAEAEIYATGLIRHGSVTGSKVVRVPKCYPVYRSGYKAPLTAIQEYLSQQRGLTVIGRYGAFKYNNQDHSILMGLLAAENVADGAGHDLWMLNSDYEYQESSRLTAAGLAPS